MSKITLVPNLRNTFAIYRTGINAAFSVTEAKPVSDG